METLLQDLRYAIRMLMKKPGFAAVAVITLALGIGANTAIFSVVNAVLLRSLPYPEADRLVVVTHHYPALKLQAPVSPTGFADYRSQSDLFENVSVSSGWSVNLTGEGEPERIRGRLVSASFFPTLKVEAALGRLFTAEEDQPGQNRVVVITHGFWQQRFGADPQVAGKTLNLNGNAYTVIGVLPAGFEFGDEVVVYAPLALSPDQLANQRGNEFLFLVARLKPGVTIAATQAQMDTIAGRIKEQRLGGYPADWGLTVRSLTDLAVGDIRPALLVLLGAVGFVLLIACANVANLMLARSTARQKEIAIRTALGASRFRVIRQLLTESTILSLVGGTLGLALAVWGVDLLVRIDQNNIPRSKEIAVDLYVLGFSLLVSLLTGILFGFVPAIQASKITLNETLKEGGRGSTGSGRQRAFRSLLVVSEIALALVLLVGAGLLIKSFARLLDVSPGFRTDNLLTMQISLPASKYGEAHQVAGFYKEAIERIRAVPGVETASAISDLPLSGSVSSGSFRIQGRPPLTPGELAPHSDRRAITPDYFNTLGIPMLKGRTFSDSDVADRQPVAIIDETMAKKYWPDEDPLGKHLSFQSNNGQPVWREIVGLVGPVKHIGLDGVVRGQLYIPHAQNSRSSLFIAVRTANDPATMMASVKSALQSVDKDLPVYNIKTMDEYLSNSVAQKRFSMMLLGLFAVIALALAVIGLYGVMSYSVAQRTHEIGIRMALGAQKKDVLKLVVKQGMVLAGIGVAIGLGGAIALTRYMESLLFNVTATDPLTFAVIAIILAVVALLASYIPARRATKVDPMVALRYE